MKNKVLGVGISEVGKYPTSYKRVEDRHINTKEYETWRGMLRRCHSQEYLEKHPSYLGCSVSENFKNFQFFAGWCNNQIGFGLDGYQLDKDILVKGNKHYSEYTCVFIPKRLNTFLINSKATRGEYPIGVYYKKDERKFVAQIRDIISPNRHQKVLGKFQTCDEAFIAYKKGKEEMAKTLSEYYVGKVDERVINSLLKYTIEKED